MSSFVSDSYEWHHVLVCMAPLVRVAGESVCVCERERNNDREKETEGVFTYMFVCMTWVVDGCEVTES